VFKIRNTEGSGCYYWKDVYFSKCPGVSAWYSSREDATKKLKIMIRAADLHLEELKAAQLRATDPNRFIISITDAEKRAAMFRSCVIVEMTVCEK
jgi:hypothetical protein